METKMPRHKLSRLLWRGWSFIDLCSFLFCLLLLLSSAIYNIMWLRSPDWVWHPHIYVELYKNNIHKPNAQFIHVS